MNVHITYRLQKTPASEKEIQHHIEKLQKRLQVFRPDLVHLKGMVEETTSREGISVSLNLRLPSGQMAVESNASSVAAAVKSAFDDLLQQVNKHKELLRSTHKWTRRQKEDSTRRNVSVPFEQTLAAVFPETVSSDDVRSYVNVNLSRLERFVERAIYFREAADMVAEDAISKEEVIDETIAAALGDDQERPACLGDFFEQWQKVGQTADFLFINQNVRFCQPRLHRLGIRHEVRRKITFIELHAFHDFQRGFDRFGFFDSDGAIFTDLVHGIGNDLTNCVVPVCRDGCDLSDFGSVGNLL